MKLHYHPLSPNARPVLATLEHLGLSVDKQVVDITQGEQQNPEFVALNPNGKIPVLEDGDFVLWESAAICQYLADAYGQGTLYASEPRGRADITRWLLWRNAHWHPACSTITFENVIKPMLGQQRDDAKAQEGRQQFAQFAPVLEQRLGQGAFLVGDTVTIADFSVASSLSYWEQAQIPLGDYPAIRAWLERLDGVSGWKETAPKLG